MSEVRRVTAADVIEIAHRHRNWNRWGENDQLGTVNFIDAECVIHAASLVRQGKVISCALPYDENGPQNGGFGRVNPIHIMLQDGGDAAIGAQSHLAGLCYADDAVYMPLQSGTQWDALAHIFYDGKMYNGPPLSIRMHGRNHSCSFGRFISCPSRSKAALVLAACSSGVRGENFRLTFQPWMVFDEGLAGSGLKSGVD